MSRNDVFGAQSVHEQMMAPNLERLQQDLGYDIPVETVPLPSQGLAYPVGHPLHRKTTVEIRAMTAREEDILTSRALIKNGTVITRLIQSCLIDQSIDASSLVSGDRNALMIAIRITGYGATYNVEMRCSNCEIKQPAGFNLSDLGIKPLNVDPESIGENGFSLTLPVSGKSVVVRFQTGQDEEESAVVNERKKKQGIGAENLVTDQLMRSITHLDGDPDKSKISQFVRYMPAADSLTIRKFLEENEPGVDMTVNFKCDYCQHEEEVSLPIGTNFFWPQA